MPTEPNTLTDYLSADQVAIQLSIPIPRLRAIRREVLREGEHWIRDPHDDRRTLFSPAAIECIRRELTGIPTQKLQAQGGEPGTNTPLEAGSATSEPQDAVSVAPAPPTPSPILEETLTVVSSPRAFPGGEIKHHPNPRVISAKRPSGEVVYVRVAESRNFIAKTRDGSPMTIQARFEGNPPNWSLVGRCPRYLGRW